MQRYFFVTGSEGGPLGGGKRAHRHQNCEEKKIYFLCSRPCMGIQKVNFAFSLWYMFKTGTYSYLAWEYCIFFKNNNTQSAVESMC